MSWESKLAAKYEADAKENLAASVAADTPGTYVTPSDHALPKALLTGWTVLGLSVIGYFLWNGYK